jgi:hypothetical protein
MVFKVFQAAAGSWPMTIFNTAECGCTAPCTNATALCTNINLSAGCFCSSPSESFAMSNQQYYGPPVEKPGPVYHGHGQHNRESFFHSLIRLVIVFTRWFPMFYRTISGRERVSTAIPTTPGLWTTATTTANGICPETPREEGWHWMLWSLLWMVRLSLSPLILGFTYFDIHLPV